MIKILHYLRNLGLGGTEKTCQLFFEHASSDFEVTVIHEESGDYTRIEEFNKAARVSKGLVHAIDSYGSNPRLKGDPDPAPLQEVIDTLKPDILHVYRSGYSEFPANCVYVPHTVETNVFGFLDPSLNGRTLFMSKWLMDYALKSGRWNVKAFAWAKDRFDYVNNPVEMPYTDATFSHLSSDAIWLGRCGRPDNGIYNSVSVDAARLLRLQGYDIRFLVVAAPPNMILDLERYKIPFEAIAPTTDPLVLSQFYNSVDIYAHARADGETFGVNIAEAMIHGKPVVTHIATPSFPGMGVFQSQTELVEDGLTGFIVQNNAAEYAEALKRIIEDDQLAAKMRVLGRFKATRDYHVDACMKKLERIYREVVS